MNNAVNQVILTDVTASQKQRGKAGDTESGEFGGMLSDAIQSTNRRDETGETQAKDTAPDTQTETSETEAQEQEQAGEVSEQEYVIQFAAAMMTQKIVPMITDAPQEETGTEETAQETAESITEDSGFQLAQTTVPEEATTQTGEAAAIQEQNTPIRAARHRDAAGVRARETAGAADVQGTAAEEGQLNSQTLEKAAEAAKTGQQPKYEATPLSKEITDSKTETTDLTGEQVADQTQQAIRMHNMRHPQQAAETQDRFDSMLAKASQELNPTVDETGAETETEIFDEPELEQEKPFILEEEPQENAEQEEMTNARPEAETNPREETKTAAQTDVQKMTKAPVTEQRQQQEISKPDETLMGMAQQKQPEAIQETVRSEQVQQPQQPQQPQAVEQADQIKAQLVKNLETQRTEFQMQLHPEELGKINVKMILEAGKLTVEIVAANPKSAEMLSRQADALAMSLKAGNIESTTVNVVAAPENASSQMNGQFDLNNFQNRFRNQDHTTNKQKGTNPANDSDEQGGVGGQLNSNIPKAPQRILNYSV